METMTIAEIKSQRSKDEKLVLIVLCKVSITSIRSLWYYESCGSYNRRLKMTYDGTYDCNNCNLNTATPVPRVKLQVQAQDDSGSATFVLFENILHKIVSEEVVNDVLEKLSKVTGLVKPVGWGGYLRRGGWERSVERDTEEEEEGRDQILGISSGGGAYALAETEERRCGEVTGARSGGFSAAAMGSGTWRQAWRWCVEEEQMPNRKWRRDLHGMAMRGGGAERGHIHRES
ncbi:hypothetical protein Scep_014792 [Stephania cephalantha]|uniref:Replication factor A C-terminal domain-containing protein n=1 Tax=Stephania cephalantha TaxID=152367 RepID=A0AAP0J1U7_9MAGN